MEKINPEKVNIHVFSCDKHISAKKQYTNFFEIKAFEIKYKLRVQTITHSLYFCSLFCHEHDIRVNLNRNYVEPINFYLLARRGFVKSSKVFLKRISVFVL